MEHHTRKPDGLSASPVHTCNPSCTCRAGGHAHRAVLRAAGPRRVPGGTGQLIDSMLCDPGLPASSALVGCPGVIQHAFCWLQTACLCLPHRCLRALVAAPQGGGLVQILCGFIGNVKDRGMLALLPVMDAVVQVSAGQSVLIME